MNLNTRRKRICVRLFEHDFDELQLIADTLKRSWEKKGNVGSLIRQLVKQRIVDFHAECRKREEAVKKAKAKGRKLLREGQQLSDKTR